MAMTTTEVRAGPDPRTLNPDELLTVNQVAALLTELRGRVIKPATIRSYVRFGTIVVADVQEGGRDPNPGETLPTTNHKGKRDERIPQPGEKIRPTRRLWKRGSIIDWEDHRPGPGRWAEFRGSSRRLSVQHGIDSRGGPLHPGVRRDTESEVN